MMEKYKIDKKVVGKHGDAGGRVRIIESLIIIHIHENEVFRE